MRTLVALLGPIAGLVIGVIFFFTQGERAAIIVFAVISLGAFVLASWNLRWMLALGLVAELATIGLGARFIVDQALTIQRALAGSSDIEADPADTEALAAAEAVVENQEGGGAFRIALSEREITAMLQDGLRQSDAPLRRVELDIQDGGIVSFFGEFKEGDLTLDGSAIITVTNGTVDVEILSVDLGSLTLPGVGENALEDAIDDLLTSVSDLSAILAESGAEVQSVVFGDDQLVVTGTQRGGALLTSATLLADLTAQAAALTAAVEPPPERIGPGTVNALRSDGDSFYVALGDSLAANVGVEEPRDGYVSRVHKVLEQQDETTYGLRNLGITGETSGSLIRAGQLDEAVEFMKDNPIAYVTIDIGGNDLLGHLGSEDCAESIQSASCQDRIGTTFVSYRRNMAVVFAELRDAAPDAVIVFMRAYNPFSLGLGVNATFEQESSRILDEFNDIAAALAPDHDILVADGFTPMLGTTSVTTHMLDRSPDIHPYPIGFDVLAVSIVKALAAG